MKAKTVIAATLMLCCIWLITYTWKLGRSPHFVIEPDVFECEPSPRPGETFNVVFRMINKSDHPIAVYGVSTC